MRGNRTLWYLAPLVAAATICACREEEPQAPPAECEFSGVTPRDETGALTGPEDPDDWCASVSVAPNPTSTSCTVDLLVQRTQRVVIAVHSPEAGDLLVLADQSFDVGSHRLLWDLTMGSGTPVSSGLYCITVTAEDFSCDGDLQVQ
jgi:hypothetical protein